jgi:hypothetical protein
MSHLSSTFCQPIYSRTTSAPSVSGPSWVFRSAGMLHGSHSRMVLPLRLLRDVCPTLKHAAEEPRVTVGVPIIGCPDYLTLIQLRADKHHLALGPPYMPASLRALIQRADPPSAPFRTPNASNPFYGKRILVLSGADDQLVPWSASRGFIEGLEVGEKGRKDIMLVEGVGHAYPETMKREAFRFVLEEVLHARNSAL